jgi:exopolyphosphatase/guanosine-5'-triphosphate,3'-diphosphate pyrophosphatase
VGEIAEALRARRIETTDYSLRDGMLEEEVRALRGGVATAVRSHLKDIFERARRWGLDARHLRHVEGFARLLFDRLASVHRLGRSWRDYVVAAAWLQDVGEKVSPVHHERHSCYMVKNGDFPGLEPWELEFIGQLVLWHKGGKLERTDIPFSDRARRGAFIKLLAFLRVIDALEKPQAHLVTLRAVRRARGVVRLDLTGERSAVDLAILRLEQKKELFEKVFGLTLAARRAG